MATKTTPKNRITENGAALPSSLFSLDRLEIEVVGVTPLLCSNPAGMQPEEDASGRPAVKKSKSKQEICDAACYLDGDGDCAFPNVALRSAIFSGADMMKLRVGPGKYAPTALTILTHGLSLDHKVRLVKLYHPKTKKPLTLKDYEIDMQRAVNPKTQGGIVAIRPRFDEWAATFSMNVDSGNPTLMGVIDSSFDQILRFTGATVGIGANRGMIRKYSGKKVIYMPGASYGLFAAQIRK